MSGIFSKNLTRVPLNPHHSDFDKFEDAVHGISMNILTSMGKAHSVGLSFTSIGDNPGSILYTPAIMIVMRKPDQSVHRFTHVILIDRDVHRTKSQFIEDYVLWRPVDECLDDVYYKELFTKAGINLPSLLEPSEIATASLTGEKVELHSVCRMGSTVISGGMNIDDELPAILKNVIRRMVQAVEQI